MPKPAIPLMVEEEADPVPKEGAILESEIDASHFSPIKGRESQTEAGRDRMIQMSQDRNKQLRREREANIARQRQQELNAELPEEEQSVSGEVSVSIFFNSMSEWVTTQKKYQD